MFQYANAKAHCGLCVKKSIMWKNKIVMHMVPNCDYDMRGGCVLRAGLRRVALDLYSCFTPHISQCTGFAQNTPKRAILKTTGGGSQAPTTSG